MATSESKPVPSSATDGANVGPTPWWHVFVSRPAQTIVLVAVFMVAPLLIPGMANRLSLKGQAYREMLPSPRDLISFNGSKKSPGAGDMPGTRDAGGGPGETTAQDRPAGDANVSDKDIEDPTGSLGPFYAALAKTEAKQTGAITRILHYGDSPITNDGLSAPVRHLLQQKYGDAGHGFILIDRPWAWYGHQGITFNSGGWDNNSLMEPGSANGAFGLGGVSFTANGAGRTAKYATAVDGDTGKNFSRIDVYYLKQGGGGQFGVSINGGEPQSVSTDGPAGESGFFEAKAASPGANSFEVRSLGGPIRLFGAVLENDDPGIVYDSLGVNGAYAGLLATVMNEQHWASQLQHRRPDLVIVNYGTNESQYASDAQMAIYDRDLREVVRRVRAALPGAAILICSPMDRGKRLGGKVVTNPAIPKIVAMQRNVALTSGCAFFNLFQAMGGDGTMARWHEGKDHLVGGDLTHPNEAGALIVGTLIYQSLVNGYERYKQQHPPATPAASPQK
jgi:lysophospholipase L1-like esterase